MRIAVLFGGASSEREVSVISAGQVIPALRARGHDVIAVDATLGPVGREAEAAVLGTNVAAAPPPIQAGNPFFALSHEPALREADVVFIALHGGDGENGKLQAVLQLAGICHTGSGVTGSAVAMDKALAKSVMRAEGIPTPDWLLAPSAVSLADAHDIGAELGWPLICKPNSEGSTVGLSLVSAPEALASAVAEAAKFDTIVLLERFIAGRELTCGVLADRALAVGEIVPRDGGLFDYASKYQAGGASKYFPAEIAPELARLTQAHALGASRALRTADYCRADFRLDATGNIWCLEVNTLPGMTAGSLMPRSAAAEGIEFPALCERICELALSRAGGSESRLPQGATSRR